MLYRDHSSMQSGRTLRCAAEQLTQCMQGVCTVRVVCMLGDPLFVSLSSLAAMGVSGVCLLLLLVELSLCSPAFSYSHDLLTRQADADCSPTPFGFRDSFLANCTAIPGLDSATCNRAWMNFSMAFANRDPARVMGRLVKLIYLLVTGVIEFRGSVM